MDNVYRNIEDEDKVSILPLVVKQIIGIDIEDPTSYFESQIPLIGYLDLSNLITNQDKPVVIVADSENEQNSDNNEIDEPKEPPKK
ncbi:hypothetical protein PL321_15830 [Caloramator sp. mosi_1]|uniref:hypothetical protein n=1 Tax=Caloramator sp. mosi_1 TaxID=3023090 RepID=UPI002362697E|nr:hypothetical protein [Caloramator sp. mosi_1]WDC83898.1 hypothetical protein PL321_15830 [Caloramator sp. mosi_1]